MASLPEFQLIPDCAKLLSRKKCLVHIQVASELLEELYPNKTLVEQMRWWARDRYGEDFIRLAKYYCYEDGGEMLKEPTEVLPGIYGMWKAKIVYWKTV